MLTALIVGISILIIIFGPQKIAAEILEKAKLPKWAKNISHNRKWGISFLDSNKGAKKVLIRLLWFFLIIFLSIYSIFFFATKKAKEIILNKNKLL